MGLANIGVKLLRGDGATPEVFTECAEIRKTDMPEIISEYVDSTVQSSTRKEKAWGGISELAAFKMTIRYNPVQFKTFRDDCADGIAHNYQVKFKNGEVWEFEAGIGSFKNTTSDAKSPDVLESEIEIVPLGDWTFTEAPVG
jgi:hypothetical protein